jgi:transposase
MTETFRIGSAADIQVTNVVESGGSLVVSGVSSGSNQCPDCGEPSSRGKRVYKRYLQDLPVQGVSVRIVVHVRRWRCRNHTVARGTVSPADREERVAPRQVDQARQNPN